MIPSRAASIELKTANGATTLGALLGATTSRRRLESSVQFLGRPRLNLKSSSPLAGPEALF